MWKAVQTIGIFEDDNEEFFEGGSNPVSKKLKEADGTVKIGADTSKYIYALELLLLVIKPLSN